MDKVRGRRPVMKESSDPTASPAATQPRSRGVSRIFLSLLGTYIYIETSGISRRQGEKARLESELFQATNGKCFSFWYHMYGRDIGTLNIYKKDSVSETLLQTYNGSQGNIWKEGEVGLYSRTSFKVNIKITPISFAVCISTEMFALLFVCNGSYIYDAKI